MSQVHSDLLNAAGSTADLTESERHRLLEDDRRRRVLEVLADRSGPIRLREMAVAVADRETGGDADDPETVSAVATALHHIHLPKLDELGVLAYDLDDNRITR